MIEKIMKEVKRGNKKRSINITVGAVVGFLLSCTAVMGAGLEITENAGKFIPSIEIKGNTLKNNTYTNNEIISEKISDNTTAEGIKISGTSKSILSIVNKDTVSVENAAGTGIVTGIGITAGTDITGILKNDGVIKAENKGTEASNGILMEGSLTGNVENNGTISSTAAAGASYGIKAGTVDGDILNKGLITSTVSNNPDQWAIGINNDVNATGKILNTGNIILLDGSNKYSIGINNNAGKVGKIINRGNINSTSTADARGIVVWTTPEGGSEILNEGLIKGTAKDTSPIDISCRTKAKTNITALVNNGVMYGKKGVIYLANASGETATIAKGLNYGILANNLDNMFVVGNGATLDFTNDENPAENKIANYGLAFTANDDGTYTMIDTVGTGIKDEAGRTLLNAEKETNPDSAVTGTKSIEFSDLTSGKSYVLNGIDKTLKVADEGKELNGSIINAYKTAVVLESGAGLSTENTLFNGGADGKSETIHLAGNNTFAVKGDSVINGDIKNIESDGTAVGSNKISIVGSTMNGNLDIAGDNNELNLNESFMNGNTEITGNNNNLNVSGENTYVNGDMTAIGDGNALNLTGGESQDRSLNIFHKVEGFNEISIDKNVKFSKNAETKDINEMNIAGTGVLNLGLDKTSAGRATHAFSNNESVIDVTGDGTIKFLTNGMGKGADVDMSTLNLGDDISLRANSILHTIEVSEDGQTGKIGTASLSENLPNYDSVNKIYKSAIQTDDNVNALLELTDSSSSYEEQNENLVLFLEEIYAESPYSYSSELSRKSAGMFRDIVADNMFRPNLNQWLVMGGLTHIDGGTEDRYYGKNSYKPFDTAADTKLTGAYALGKYGYSENVTLGVTAGGNRSEAELNRSKVKGNSGYIGAFAENYRGNLTLKAGAGVQYSEYDADRNTIGGYSYSDKYSDMTYDIYLNGRYSHNIGDNLFLEPYGTLSYTYVDQEGTDEGSKVLAIETDSKSFDYTSAKVGVDLKKVIPHEKGKSILSAGVSYTRLLSGADSDNLTGRFEGGSDFDILVASKNEYSLGLNAKYTLELENGVLFDVKGTYSIERDSYNDGNTRNRNKGEWIVGAGLGYKF